MKLQIDTPHASVSVAARHMMLSTVRANFSGTTGEIEFDANKPEGAKVRLRIPAASVDTGDPKRDGHLKSADFLDVERYPEITFVGTKVRKGESDNWIVSGDLTIRGTTRPVDVQVEVTGVVDGKNGKIAGFAATSTIDRTLWGLVWNMPIPGGILVSEKVRVEVDLEAIEIAEKQEATA